MHWACDTTWKRAALEVMFFGIRCCCADSSSENQITYSSSGAQDAVKVGASPSMVPVVAYPACHERDEASGRVSDDSSASPPPPEARRGGGGQRRHEGPPASTPSRSSKEAEKVRLQRLVNSFVKKAVAGCPCTYLDEATQEQTVTTYRIPKNLESLSVVSPLDNSQAMFACRIGDIQDVYSHFEDGEQCFNPKVVAGLRPEERDLLLMVVCRDGRRLNIVEESHESRDTLLECLRILCVYAQASASSGEARR